MDNVFLACPLYDGRMDFGTSMRLAQAARRRRAMVQFNTRSLLASNCNKLWCAALNQRQSHGFKWFAMLHADIDPEAYWLDKLLDEAERYDADLLSAVVPIKDARGLVSTAIDSVDGGFRQFCRLTLKQVHDPAFPDTFGIQEAAAALERLPAGLRIENVPRTFLLVNTGCFVCRLDRPWSEKVWFEIRDGISCRDGVWREEVVSEDWMFSKAVAANGGKVMATRIVSVDHYGSQRFPSQGTWGNPRDVESLGPSSES